MHNFLYAWMNGIPFLHFHWEETILFPKNELVKYSIDFSINHFLRFESLKFHGKSVKKDSNFSHYFSQANHWNSIDWNHDKWITDSGIFTDSDSEGEFKYTGCQKSPIKKRMGKVAFHFLSKKFLKAKLKIFRRRRVDQNPQKVYCLSRQFTNITCKDRLLRNAAKTFVQSNWLKRFSVINL